MRIPERARDRRRRAGAALLAALALAACGDKPAEEQPVPPPAAPPPSEGVQVEITLPDSVGWARTGQVGLRVANRGRTPLEAGARLELFVAAPVEPVASPAGPAAPQAASSGEGTRLLFSLAPLAPGQASELTQGVRLPPSPSTPPRTAADSASYGRFILRARVLGASGQPVGPATEDTLAVLGGATAALGCGAGGALPVTRHGIGSVRLGMARAAVESLCPGTRDTTWAGQEGLKEKGVAIPFGATDTLLATLAGDRLDRLRIRKPGLATAAGMGVGSTLADLRGRYGRTCAGVAEGRVAVWFPNAPGISFALTATPPAEWGRAERDPALLPDTTTVTELWVRRGTDDCPQPAAAPTATPEGGAR